MTEAVQIALIAATPPTLVALVAAIASFHNTAKLTQVKIELNGRMTQLLKSREEEGHSQGMRDQIAQDASGALLAQRLPSPASLPAAKE